MLRFHQPGCETAVIDFAAQFRSKPTQQGGIDLDRWNNFFARDRFEPRNDALHGSIIGLHCEGQGRALAPELFIEQVLVRLRDRSNRGDPSMSRQHYREGSQGKTEVVPQQVVTAKDDAAKNVVLKDGATVEELVRALTAIGSTARDIIAILQNLRAAGALDAELEVI